MRKEFQSLDVNQDGSISKEEVEALLKSIKSKLKMTNQEIKQLVEKIDKDNDGNISIEEFLSLITSGDKRDAIYKTLLQRAGVRKLFEKYDRDKNGVITRNEFKKVVEDKYQASIRPEKIDQMMKNVDRNGDGEIDYDEFYKAFRYFPVNK